LKEIKNDPAFGEEAKLLKQYLQLLEQEAATKKNHPCR
jgi:type I restriction enzyme M protein